MCTSREVANITSATTVTSATPNINSTTLTTHGDQHCDHPATGKATSTFEGSPSVQTPQYDFFGQKFITTRTAQYDATDRTTFTLTITTSSTPSAKVPRTTTDIWPVSQLHHQRKRRYLRCGLRPTNNWISAVRRRFSMPTMSSPRRTRSA